MKNSNRKATEIICMMCSVAFFTVYLCLEFVLNGTVSGAVRLIFILLSCIFLGLFSKAKYKMITKKTYLCFFVVYMAFLLNLTLFDSLYGRHISALPFKNISEILTYLNEHTNLIPFKTLALYIKGYANAYVDIASLTTNLLGNIIAFMPFGFFLPLFFPKCKNMKNFFWTITLIVFGIELSQLILMSGVFDVDDIILNVAGGIISFIICQKYIISKLHI